MSSGGHPRPRTRHPSRSRTGPGLLRVGPLRHHVRGSVEHELLLVGAAALRSDANSRTGGPALLVPGIIVFLMLVHIAAGLDSPGTVFVISECRAMARLAIGQTPRSDAEAADREEAESATDATASG